MKTRRHAKILELIAEKDIDTQEELLRCLRECGFDVTQATVSRDIKELRLIKSLSGGGKYKYTTGKEDTQDISAKFLSMFSDSIRMIEAAGNLIVIKTMTGMAQAVCAAIDSMQPKPFVGTLAGEDTILIVCKTEQQALEMQEELKKVVSGK